MSGFEKFDRPPRRRGQRRSEPRITVAKDRHQLLVTTSARALLGVEPRQRARVDLLFDPARNLIGLRLDETGAYRFTVTGAISCGDFIEHYQIEAGRYAASSISSKVVAAQVKVRP